MRSHFLENSVKWIQKKSVKFFSQVLHLGKKDPSPYTGSGVTGDEKILQLCDTEI